MYGAPVGTCQMTCVLEMSPRPPGPERGIRTAAISAREIDDAVVVHRHRNRELVGFVEVPERAAGCRIERFDADARIDDELIALRRRHDERRAVRQDAARPVRLPELFAGPRIERDQI